MTPSPSLAIDLSEEGSTPGGDATQPNPARNRTEGGTARAGIASRAKAARALRTPLRLHHILFVAITLVAELRCRS